MQENPNRSLPFWIVTIAVVSGLTLPYLVRDGMFMDAVLYSTVAHNLSKGMGTFWHPVFSKIQHWNLPKTFHEQPPLGFYIQSLFYRINGDGWLGERIYTLLMLISTAVMIAGFWRFIFHDDKTIKNLSWLPVLIWITIPVCFWSYRNDMCENTMGIFTLSAIWLLYRNMTIAKPSWLLYLFSGLLIFCASLVKGFPGLYPLAFPILYFITLRAKSLTHATTVTIILTATVCTIYGLLLTNPEAYHSLHIYFFDRLLVRVASDPTVGNHYSIIWSLTQELMAAIILCVLAFIYYRKNSITISRHHIRLTLLFLLLGLAGTMPLMLTRVQKAFYCVAALPCFAIAAAIYISTAAEILAAFIATRYILYRSILYVGIAAIVSVIIISGMLYGQVYRDPEQLHDVHIMAMHIPKGGEVAVSPWLDLQYSFECYLMRYDEISYCVDKDKTEWYLSEKNTPFTDPAYEKRDWGMIYTDVYERRK